MNLLESIMAERRRDIARDRLSEASPGLAAAQGSYPRRSLRSVLRGRSGTRILAEVKRASPSAGPLRTDYDPAAIAAAYEDAGASAISVLTEPRRFLGSMEHLRSVRGRVNIPVLCKDFICDPFQIQQAAACGADVVLLIVAALTRDELVLLHGEIRGRGLETLVEVHDESELDAALALDGAVIGVNNRNLTTLACDLAVSRRLAASIPAGRPRIAESGIRTRRDIEELEDLGYDGFLVGESLLRHSNPAEALRLLLGSSRATLNMRE